MREIHGCTERARAREAARGVHVRDLGRDARGNERDPKAGDEGAEASVCAQAGEVDARVGHDVVDHLARQHERAHGEGADKRVVRRGIHQVGLRTAHRTAPFPTAPHRTAQHSTCTCTCSESDTALALSRCRPWTHGQWGSAGPCAGGQGAAHRAVVRAQSTTRPRTHRNASASCAGQRLRSTSDHAWPCQGRHRRDPAGQGPSLTDAPPTMSADTATVGSSGTSSPSASSSPSPSRAGEEAWCW